MAEKIGSSEKNTMTVFWTEKKVIVQGSAAHTGVLRQAESPIADRP